MDFIDQHCTVFDSEEESPHELTKIHENFVETVFGLIEKFLADIGISQEDFSETCQREVVSGGRNSFVFQQIMAADDFQAFKKMMLQRKKQLDYEALKKLQRLQIAAGMTCAATDTEDDATGAAAAQDVEDDEEMRQIEEALRLSRMTFAQEDMDPDLGTQFTCFTGTKVQILTQKAVPAEVLRISAQESVQAARQQLQPTDLTEDQLIAAAIQVRVPKTYCYEALRYTTTRAQDMLLSSGHILL